MNDRINYERLKALYQIGIKLSVFESVEDSFPKILKCAAEVFPFKSAVLIEHWEQKPKITSWFSSESTYQDAVKATIHAKEAYYYLSGATIDQTSDSIEELTFDKKTPKSKIIKKDNFISLPLVIDYLPPLGALQLEGASPLNEEDLEFVHVLTSLMSVALDRLYKTKWETERRQSEAARNLFTITSSKNRIAELEIEKDLREAFVSLLTHDLKTPLSIMVGSAELILRKKDSPEACSKYAHSIIAQGGRVNLMINNLLDANRIKSGSGLAIKKDFHDIRDLIKETVSGLVFMHGDRFQVDGDQPVIAFCDPNAIRRILENLCNNAVKYGSPDTPITIGLKVINSFIELSVNNKGDVISEDDRRDLFEQFRRTQAAESSKRPGWGIGLTLVRGMAKAHGGTVKVTSDEVSGTTFTVTFPK